MRPPRQACRAALVASAMVAGIAYPNGAFATSCKQAASCEEAVAMWCGGYTRADGDHDGVPCENVCHSLEQVEKIKQEIGC